MEIVYETHSTCGVEQTCALSTSLRYGNACKIPRTALGSALCFRATHDAGDDDGPTPKYATDHDKPISVTMRFPRALYDQAQHHAQRRQTTLTELVLEGVQLRLDTPTDPRDILVSQDNTVMQELRQMESAKTWGS